MNVTVYRLSVMLRRQRRMTRMSRLFQNPEFRNTLEHFIENTVIEHVKQPLPKTQVLLLLLVFQLNQQIKVQFLSDPGPIIVYSCQ